MSAFDTLAPSYDKEFTHTAIGQILRNRVHNRLLSHFKAGDSLLEMGCGTGEDALFLAEKGLQITATDASEKMLSITREKTKHLPNVTLSQLDLAHLPSLRSGEGEASSHFAPPRGVGIHRAAEGDGVAFTGAFSNFGALNCLNDWETLAAWLGEAIPKGGVVGLGIMSPYCAWEFAWHALHWKWNIALRRLRGSEFEGIRITYPTVQRITDDFSPYFRRVHLMPLGLFLPTSALFDVVQKRPKLMNTLVGLENRFGNIPQFAMLADHYWIEFERI
jgi:SAM-dependent methyltransferase